MLNQMKDGMWDSLFSYACICFLYKENSCQKKDSKKECHLSHHPGPSTCYLKWQPTNYTTHTYTELAEISLAKPALLKTKDPLCATRLKTNGKRQDSNGQQCKPAHCHQRQMTGVHYSTVFSVFVSEKFHWKNQSWCGTGQGGREGGRWHYKCPSASPCRTWTFDLLTHLGVISNASLTCHFPFNPCIQLPRRREKKVHKETCFLGGKSRQLGHACPGVRETTTDSHSCKASYFHCKPGPVSRVYLGVVFVGHYLLKSVRGSTDFRKWRNLSILTTGFGTRP